MTDDEIMLMNELDNRVKLTGAEKAKLKVLKKKANKGEPKKEEKVPTKNVFAIRPTTQLKPLPIRFSEHERAGLSELANDIISAELEQVIMELGSVRDVNETKLIRAAVLLLKDRSHQEIIAAIKEVKLSMIR